MRSSFGLHRGAPNSYATLRSIFIAIFLLCLSQLALAQAEQAETSSAEEETQPCERLKTRLLYKQEDAPRDISTVLRVVIERINQELKGVTNVEVKWTGADLHRRIGRHMVQTLVSRSSDTKECFEIPIVIQDTDECRLPVGHEMRHQCHGSSVCVNTLGGYECLCPLLDVKKQKEVEEALHGLLLSADKAMHADADAYTEVQHHSEAWQQVIKDPPRSAWEVSLKVPGGTSGNGSNARAVSSSSSRSSCPSTAECCPTVLPSDAHSAEGQRCRSLFYCPTDPCATTTKSSTTTEGHHDCVPQATCTRTPSPLTKPNYTCLCPPGTIGNGRICPPSPNTPTKPRRVLIKPDGTLVSASQQHDCGCTLPTIDPCADVVCPGKHEICIPSSEHTQGWKCQCKPNFLLYQNRCVDKTPPILRLQCDPNKNGINKFVQGQRYQECAVAIHDDNAEDYYRSLKIEYDVPLQGCFTTMGTFHVTYRVDTPWTTPSSVSLVRTVEVEDFNECTLLDPSRLELKLEYEETCPSVVPHCDVAAGATCVNTEGSYGCQCPMYTSGDGFVPIESYDTMWDAKMGTYRNAPKGYRGGTGCVDKSKPKLELQGPNPKIFRVVMSTGIGGGGESGGGVKDEDGDGSAVQKARDVIRGSYEEDLQRMVEVSGGVELCMEEEDGGSAVALSSGQLSSPLDCVYAYDVTYNGTVDLSDRVQVGELTRLDATSWKIPYDVTDDAGNRADTVYRKIVVLEMTPQEWYDYKRSLESPGMGMESKGRKECPPCPPCKGKNTRACPKPPPCDCDARCKQFAPSPPACPSSDASSEEKTLPRNTADEHDEYAHPHDSTTTPPSDVLGLMWGASLLSHFFPTVLVKAILAIAGLMVVICAWNLFLVLILQPRSRSRYEEERERQAQLMAESVTYYRSPSPTMNRRRVPRTEGSNGAGGASSMYQEAPASMPPPNRSNMYRPSPEPSSGNGSSHGGTTTTTTPFGSSRMSPITPSKYGGSPPLSASR